MKQLQKNKLYLGKKLVDNQIDDCYIDVEKAKHIGVFGQTGGGKTKMLESFIASIVYDRDDVEQIILIDFKGGLSAYPIANTLLNYDINIDIATTIDQTNALLTYINEVNEKRMKINKQNEVDFFNGKRIHVIIDETANVLLYEPKDKEEKEKLKNITYLYDKLHRDARSQRIYIYSFTQSLTKINSGISTGTANNIVTKIMFNTDNKESINSVFSTDELESNGLNVKELSKGEFVMKNYDGVFKCKGVLIEDIQSTLKEILKDDFQYIKGYWNNDWFSRFMYWIGFNSFEKQPIYFRNMYELRQFYEYKSKEEMKKLEAKTLSKTKSESVLESKV